LKLDAQAVTDSLQHCTNTPNADQVWHVVCHSIVIIKQLLQSIKKSMMQFERFAHLLLMQFC
jgi:hypothetical protein